MTSIQRIWQTTSGTMTSTSVFVLLLLTVAQITEQCTDVTKLKPEMTSSSKETSRLRRSAGSAADALEESDELEKRKWEKNTVRVWGKRDQNVFDEQMKTADDDAVYDVETEKRQWSPRNKVRVWGKRSEADLERGSRQLEAGVEADEAAIDAEEKRKWGDNRVKVWGKRNSGAGAATRPAARNRKPTNGRQNLTTGSGNGLKNEDAKADVDEIINHRVSVVKRAIEDSVAAGRAGSRGEGRYVWIPDEELPTVDEAPSSLSWRLAEKRAASGYTALTSGTGYRGSSWRSDGAGPKRSWRTNVIRVWGR